MNMNQRPTMRQLRGLVAAANDAAGHHVMWVAMDGAVNLTTLRAGYAVDLWFERMAGQIRFRVATFAAGERFVGTAASTDSEWMRDLFGHLTSRWAGKSARLRG
jgi:hypothetical protein